MFLTLVFIILVLFGCSRIAKDQVPPTSSAGKKQELAGGKNENGRANVEDQNKGIKWQVHDATSLRDLILNADSVNIEIEALRYPKLWSEQVEPEPGLTFPVSDEGRRLLARMVEEGDARLGQMSMAEGEGTQEQWFRPYPLYRLRMVSPPYWVEVHWDVASGRAFTVSQIYAPEASAVEWHPDYAPENLNWVHFIQEQPLFYEAVKELVPAPAFPPEHLGYLFHAEKVIVEMDGQRCEQSAPPLPGLGLLGYIDFFVASEETYPSAQPDARLKAFVRGQEYPVEIWRDGRFSYRGKLFLFQNPLPSEVNKGFDRYLQDLKSFLSNGCQKLR